MPYNSFNTQRTLIVGDQHYQIFDLARLPTDLHVSRLPVCLKILLENLLRNEDGKRVTAESIHALCAWQPKDKPKHQVAFTPARVLLQDFTGVPALVDLAAMRDAIVELGGDPDQINPSEPVDLVIDHSVMVDFFGSERALADNIRMEFERNGERYTFLRWGQKAFSNFRVVPPGTGIVHQVNLEYLAGVVMTKSLVDSTVAFPDTLVGTDSHTTMINGLGVLGWGVGGIEAEAAMLGQPVNMLLPRVTGFEFCGALRAGVTATDVVLTVTEMLRNKNVVGQFVEFYGDGLSNLPLAERATIANMAPEYGATCGFFAIDQETLRYLQLSGRDDAQIALVEAYAKAQGLWREEGAEPAEYSDNIALDLADVVPSLAGPTRPQDRIALSDAKTAFTTYLNKQALNIENASLARFANEGGKVAVGAEQVENTAPPQADNQADNQAYHLQHGDVVIAAITSCTNTSNPAVMLAAGLVAKKARQRGLSSRPWVKTSLAPGSQVVPDYLQKAGLMAPLAELGFDLVGFGCTTCIGNAGPLAPTVSEAIHQRDLIVCAVLSGNRNFEGRIHRDVHANYLASPPLVVAYALAGTLLIDFDHEPVGHDCHGEPVWLKDLWPSAQEINTLIATTVSASLYNSHYASIFDGPDAWRALSVPEGTQYHWPVSTYVKKPPFFVGITANLPTQQTMSGARCLVKLGDSVTTDHISPAGAIDPSSPAGHYLQEQGVTIKDFNSYGSRRGNHEVMIRGTFANRRLRNELAVDKEGGFTRFWPNDEITTIYDAAMRYQAGNTPLVVLAGKEYGTGSSRDWAAKGVYLLGVVAVIAESFERIHRSNLVGFGVLPLEFINGDTSAGLGLTGAETFAFGGLLEQPQTITVTATRPGTSPLNFEVRVRIDTDIEWEYYRHGGILHYALRQLAAKKMRK